MKDARATLLVLLLATTACCGTHATSDQQSKPAFWMALTTHCHPFDAEVVRVSTVRNDGRIVLENGRVVSLFGFRTPRLPDDGEEFANAIREHLASGDEIHMCVVSGNEVELFRWILGFNSRGLRSIGDILLAEFLDMVDVEALNSKEINRTARSGLVARRLKELGVRLRD